MTAEPRASLNAVRTDHTGGLHQPAWLRDLHQRRADGAVSDEELKAGQDRAVREVIARQESIGLPVVNDGEFRRLTGFQDSFAGAVTGYDAIPYGSREAVQQSAVDGARLHGVGSTGPHRIET